MDVLRSHVQPASERFDNCEPFRIGGASVDPTTREVSIDGKTERIQPQPLRVLMLLHRRAGQLVTRDEIVEQCWDRRIVGDDVINRSVLILRKLAERVGGFQIETIPRSGYRLVEGERNAIRWSRTRYRLALVIGCALILAVGASLYLRSRAIADRSPTITLLPVVRASGGADAAMVGTRIERALAEAIHQTGLRTQPAAKAELVVSPEIAQTSEKTRVNVTLSAGPQRTLLMVRTFERSNTSTNDLELEVAAGVIELLAATAEVMTFDRRAADPAFVSRMLASMQAAGQGDALRAYQMAVRTVRDYPDSVLAELALAVTAATTLEVFPVAERTAHVRLARDILARRQEYAPRFGEYGHTWCLLRPRSWLAACEGQLRTSLKNAETGTSSGQRLSELVADVGRHDEALPLARVASAANPYSAPDLGSLLQLLEIEGRHREAEALYAAGARKWPASWTLRWNRIIGLSARGEFAALERFAGTISRSEFTFDAEVLQSALRAHRAADGAGLKQACARENLRWSTKQVCVAALADLGEMDFSFAIAFELYPKQVGRSLAEDETLWLEHPAYFTLSLLSAPAGAPLRRDPRFLALAGQTGLLRYWRGGRLPDFCTQSRPEPVCRQLGMRA